MEEVSHQEVMAAAKLLHKQCETSHWLEYSESLHPSMLGVAIQRSDRDYVFEPASMDAHVVAAIRSVGLPVAFSMASSITSSLFSQISPYQTEIIVQPRGTRIPVIASLQDIPTRSFEIKQAMVCLVLKENIALVWSTNLEGAEPHGADVEHMLMETVWGSGFGQPRAFSRPGTMTRSSHMSSLYERPQTPQTPRLGHADSEESRNEKKSPQVGQVELDEKDDVEWDPEAANVTIAKRPMVLTHSVMVGLALILLICVFAIVVGKVLSECKYDGSFIRLAYLAVLPIYGCFALCSALLIVFTIFQLLAPVSDNVGNSRYHSAVAPNPAKFKDIELPHITIQIPIFKEGLSGVIVPTITSLKAAIKYYESVGGTASIYVNDDGMQILQPEIAESRRMYYAANNIGWCARPPHGQDDFIRKGRFKKASNMNYCLEFSNKVEDELLRLVRHREESVEAQNLNNASIEPMTAEEHNELYQRALETILIADEGRTIATGNVRIGEVILLVDCDTRVPVNCLHMGALEMIECPDVAIIQHTSGVLRVAHNVFETGISYLTDLVYTAIQFNVGSGDCSCFVGHNAFLRWKAIQSVIFEEDGVEKFWSESHVSEDFHLSLRLQIAGFEIRLASYHGDEFKEGVSLTVFDELARWEKYTYGCNELVFNPLWKWYKGPFTSLYLRYFMSNIKTSSKLMVLSYTWSYYAIASGLPLTIVNYLLLGWFPDRLDQFYTSSWKIFLVIIIIFDVMSPISYIIVRWRLGQQKLLTSIVQVVKCLPLLILFFNGLSFHLSKTILCHFFGINIEWTATAKELESTGFFIGMDRISVDFKWMFVAVILLMGGMIYLGIYAPIGWTITDWTLVVPLASQMVCHFLLPLALGLF